ncbi:MAG: AAA family ATPase, partial [Candidatus Micrarchaeota archaeon]|nr:AAA family ATPase [Candidatus Micrarchaeota archaeon]
MGIYVITGTPTTGKTTLAKYLSKLGFQILDLNSLVNRKKIWKSKDRGCKVVDLSLLEKEAKKEINKMRKESEKSIIVEGHLACEIKLPADKVIVLRTRPDVLLRRLKERGYPSYKIIENLEAELLDYCGIRAEEN